MAYKDFKLEDLEGRFGIRNKRVRLFDKVKPLKPSEVLLGLLEEAHSQPFKSEKARSELLVVPILMDLRKQNNRFFNLHSGEFLNVDKEAGLQGECDFLLGINTGSYTIAAPLISVVEAKKQDIELGINQCAAQMLGALRYNALHNQPIKTIYGCVTTGNEWTFMRMSEGLLEIDQMSYFISDLDTLMGVFQHIIDYYKAIK